MTQQNDNPIRGTFPDRLDDVMQPIDLPPDYMEEQVAAAKKKAARREERDRSDLKEKPYTFWKTTERGYIRIKDMEYRHLRNTISFLEGKGVTLSKTMSVPLQPGEISQVQLYLMKYEMEQRNKKYKR